MKGFTFNCNIDFLNNRCDGYLRDKQNKQSPAYNDFGSKQYIGSPRDYRNKRHSEYYFINAPAVGAKIIENASVVSQ